MSELKRKSGDNFQQYAVKEVKTGSGHNTVIYPQQEKKSSQVVEACNCSGNSKVDRK